MEDKIVWEPVSKDNKALVFDGKGGLETIDKALERRFPSFSKHIYNLFKEGLERAIKAE